MSADIKIYKSRHGKAVVMADNEKGKTWLVNNVKQVSKTFCVTISDDVVNEFAEDVVNAGLVVEIK